MTISYGATAVHRTLVALAAEEARYNEFLKGAGITEQIDEFALLVADARGLEQLASLLIQDFGWERFNQATDTVRTAPIRSGYGVQYVFFRRPDVAWRLEVMHLVSGVSPLHAAVPLPLPRQVCEPVHASFKTPDEEHYTIARDHLADSGLVLAQQCDSTYGRFSYWCKMGDRSSRVPYLKPRCNLRDRQI